MQAPALEKMLPTYRSFLLPPCSFFLGCGEQFLLECQFPSEDSVPDSGKGPKVAAGVQCYGLLPGRPVSVSTLLCHATPHRELMFLQLRSIGCTYLRVCLSHRKKSVLNCHCVGSFVELSFFSFSVCAHV